MENIIRIKEEFELPIYLHKCDYEIEFKEDGLYFYVKDKTLIVKKQEVKYIDSILYVYNKPIMSFNDDEQISELIELGYQVVI
ncbi:hypothetical protein [Mycoplasma sp. P36-A1]|uniref:hypothetical protein n=1 Tax=Mycoplasma sp. P36-A1 TaxID=3252900 RepID=UPI003C2E2816